MINHMHYQMRGFSLKEHCATSYPCAVDFHGLSGHLSELLSVQLGRTGVVFLLGVFCGTVVLVEVGSLWMINTKLE